MKVAYLVLIRDVAKGITHIEALPMLFDSEQSVNAYAKQRLNEQVTVIVKIMQIDVDEDARLTDWRPPPDNAEVRGLSTRPAC